MAIEENSLACTKSKTNLKKNDRFTPIDPTADQQSEISDKILIQKSELNAGPSSPQ